VRGVGTSLIITSASPLCVLGIAGIGFETDELNGREG